MVGASCLYGRKFRFIVNCLVGANASQLTLADILFQCARLQCRWRRRSLRTAVISPRTRWTFAVGDDEGRSEIAVRCFKFISPVVGRSSRWRTVCYRTWTGRWASNHL